MATLAELVNNLKEKAQTLQEMEDRLSAMLQDAVRTGERCTEWVEVDKRVIKLRRECAGLKRRIERRVETKVKRRPGRTNEGVPRPHVDTPPPSAPALFPKQ